MAQNKPIDWKQRAATMAPDMPADAAERAGAVLAELDRIFRPLTAELQTETEPSYVLLIASENPSGNRA